MVKKRCYNGDTAERRPVVVQLTFNWYSHDKGDMFYDFTVGYMADLANNPKFPHVGKTVKEITIIKTPDLHGEVTFEDGSKTIQYNINSYSLDFIEDGEKI